MRHYRSAASDAEHIRGELNGNARGSSRPDGIAVAAGVGSASFAGAEGDAMRKKEPSDLLGDLRDLSEEDVQELVNRLDLLKEGESVAAALVACGGRAVAPLRRFLLDGKPSGIFQPRQRAVEALAALGAKEVLIEYLSRETEIPDPVAQYGEEAVKGTAARLLGAWRDEEVFEVLLRLLRSKPMPGVVDAVGEFRRAEAIPEFIAALGDSVVGIFAERALRKAGEAARQALLDAALAPRPSADCETPSSLCRHRCALRLLAELALSGDDWRALSSLADDRDPEIGVRVDRIALAVADEGSRELAVRRLIRKLPEVPWFLRMEIEHWLLGGR